jgi:platelet-activating factor acetylhydrolase
MGIPKVVARLFIKLRLRKLHIWAVPNAPVLAETEKESFPVIVFSHGMAGQRNMYSVLCCELASQGYLVASIAHGDGTAWCRRVNGNTEKEPFVMPPKNREGKDEEYWLLSRKPTRPQEMSLTIDMLQGMNLGEAEANLWKSLEPGSNRYPDQIANLKGRMDFCSLVAMGHSFGGATALMASSIDGRIKRLVALDPWMYILDGTSPPAPIPTLIIHTKRFQRPEDIQQLRIIAETASKSTLLHLPDDAGHLDQTDMSCLKVGGRPAKYFTPRRFRHLLDFTHSSDAVGTIKLNNQHILNFLTAQ